MLPYFPNEKFTLTPVKAQRILAKHGTEISLEDAELMLELLRKISKLSVNEAFKRLSTGQNEAPSPGELKH